MDRSPDPAVQELCTALLSTLVAKSGLNQYLDTTLPLIASHFQADRVALFDYDEHADHFQLLYFNGYGADDRFSLGRRQTQLQLGQALRQRTPFAPGSNTPALCLPLYFRDVLEAVLLVESPQKIALDEACGRVAAIASRFLGLLMSSARLKINRQLLVDIHDLKRARQIQRSFLPQSQGTHSGAEVYGLNLSSTLVGGDYFDYFQAGDSVTQCILADACGHGMAAALIMSNFRGLIHSELRSFSGSPKFFEELNQRVFFDDDHVQYLTSVFLEYDRSQERLLYQNAGHYNPRVLRRDGAIEELPDGGPPLGMFSGSSYPLSQTRLESGEMVILFTDGVVDICDESGEYYGIERICARVAKTRDLPLDQIAESVLEDTRRFSADRPIQDDVTLFLFRAR